MSLVFSLVRDHYKKDAISVASVTWEEVPSPNPCTSWYRRKIKMVSGLSTYMPVPIWTSPNGWWFYKLQKHKLLCHSCWKAQEVIVTLASRHHLATIHKVTPKRLPLWGHFGVCRYHGRNRSLRGESGLNGTDSSGLATLNLDTNRGD